MSKTTLSSSVSFAEDTREVAAAAQEAGPPFCACELEMVTYRLGKVRHIGLFTVEHQASSRLRRNRPISDGDVFARAAAHVAVLPCVTPR